MGKKRNHSSFESHPWKCVFVRLNLGNLDFGSIPTISRVAYCTYIVLPMWFMLNICLLPGSLKFFSARQVMADFGRTCPSGLFCTIESSKRFTTIVLNRDYLCDQFQTETLSTKSLVSLLWRHFLHIITHCWRNLRVLRDSSGRRLSEGCATFPPDLVPCAPSHYHVYFCSLLCCYSKSQSCA